MNKIKMFYFYKKDWGIEAYCWHGAYKHHKIFNRTWWGISIQTKDEKINCYTLIYCKSNVYC